MYPQCCTRGRCKDGPTNNKQVKIEQIFQIEMILIHVQLITTDEEYKLSTLKKNMSYLFVKYIVDIYPQKI